MQEANKQVLSFINNPDDLKQVEIQDLPLLAEEIRETLIHTISKTGGHLGAGLGVVDLTIALHYVFNTPKDSLIWDIGHQTYPHKILTERKHKLSTIRQKNGLSGFCHIQESPYDVFGAGHSSTSISAALGITVAKNLKKDTSHTVAIIGDGAMSAGLAFEGLNNTGFLANRLIIILNDNDMSIAQPTGALKNYFSKLISSNPYINLREKTKDILINFPTLKNQIKKIESLTKNLVQGSTIFENLGLDYIGPIDGHNIENLINILSHIKQSNSSKPILIHVKTEKGKGYKPAESASDKYHGVTTFDIATGKQKKSMADQISYSNLASNILTDLAQKDELIIAITAAMPDGTGLKKFIETFPDRGFDVGIAEQHAVTFAAGLTIQGYKPFVFIYSTFLQRAYDQVIHDVAIQNLPVKFAIDRAGITGADGATHNGVYDIAFLCNIPNLVVMAPSNSEELIRMIITAHQYNDGPIAFRYPKDTTSITDYNLDAITSLEIGKGHIIKKGTKLAIISLGFRLNKVIEAVNELEIEYKNTDLITIADARFAKPIDYNLIENLIDDHQYVISIEEGSMGGFASSMLLHLSKNNLLSKARIKNIYVSDQVLPHGGAEEIYQECQMDTQGIKESIKSLLESE